MATGFHIFAYDLASETIDDYGVMSPNEGSRAMALAEERGLLYGVTWPRNHFYIYDLKNRKYNDLGRIGDVNPQAIWTDPDGHGYTVDDLGYIVKYDADKGELIRLPARVPNDPQSGTEGRSVYDAVLSPDASGVYGVTWNMECVPSSERLFKYDFDDGNLYDLGPAGGEHKLDHAGGLVFGEDGYLYYAASRKDENRRLAFRMYLFRMNPETLEREEIGPICDGDYHSEYIAKATKDSLGNLYFADTNNRPTRLYLYNTRTAMISSVEAGICLDTEACYALR
jgi:hypothetical protein